MPTSDLMIQPPSSSPVTPGASSSYRAGPRRRQSELNAEALARLQRVAASVVRGPKRIRGDLRDDMQSEAVLAFFETNKNHDPRKGVPPEGHAFLRMRGSVLDLMRREQRHRGVERTQDTAVSLDTERVRARIAVDRLLARVDGALEADDRTLLQEFYSDGLTLAEVSDHHGWSRSQGVRRNIRLIEKLRVAAGLRAAECPSLRGPRHTG